MHFIIRCRRMCTDLIPSHKYGKAPDLIHMLSCEWVIMKCAVTSHNLKWRNSEFIRTFLPEWEVMKMHCNISHAFHNLEVPKLLWQEYHYFTLTGSLKLLLARVPLFRFWWMGIYSDFESHLCRWTCIPYAYHDWFCGGLLNNI